MNPRSGDLQVATEDRPEGLSLQGCSNPLALCLSKGEGGPLATASQKRLPGGAQGLAEALPLLVAGHGDGAPAVLAQARVAAVRGGVGVPIADAGALAA